MIKNKMFLFLKEFFIPKIKFAITSVIATVVDFVLFTFVLSNYFSFINADRLSSSVGMILNFYLQKKYVFKLEKNTTIGRFFSVIKQENWYNKHYQKIAFVLSILLSLVVIEIGAQMVNLLTRPNLSYDLWKGFSIVFTNPYAAFFVTNLALAKTLSIIVKFGFNFYTKRWVFEQKKISLKKYKKK